MPSKHAHSGRLHRDADEAPPDRMIRCYDDLFSPGPIASISSSESSAVATWIAGIIRSAESRTNSASRSRCVAEAAAARMRSSGIGANTTPVDEINPYRIKAGPNRSERGTQSDVKEPHPIIDERIAALTDRQRRFLRLVYDHRNTSEIARITGEPSLPAIDKQISLAASKLGATSRIEAARLLHDHDAGVERSEFRPSELEKPTFLPLPLPVPTASRPKNEMDWRQVLAWGAIIAIGVPTLITVAAMLLSAFAQLVDGIRH
jgi:DNA-binding CsgD family transcriptional regulator